MWTDKYRPKEISDIAGNEDEVSELLSWAKNWNSDNPAVILHGPPGIGKTTLAHLVGESMNWKVTEMNASDKRTKSVVNSIAGESSKTAPITGEDKRLVILDEADNLHGHSDRGGKTAMTNVIKESQQPIILIANDFYEISRTLRNKVKDIEFDYINDKEVAKRLREICEEEGVEYTIDGLMKLAEKSDGDLRGAVNDLERYALEGEKITEDLIKTGERDRKEEIFPFLDDVLKSDSPKKVRNKSEDLDMTPPELYRWVNQNIYYEYDGVEFSEGISELAKSSVWLGRVRKTQNYKFWRYASDRITAGVAGSRTETHGGWTRWQPPRYGKSTRISDELITKITTREHVSSETGRTEIIPYISNMIEYCKPEDLTAEFAAWYDWNKDDISDITGSGSGTNKVSRVVEKSENKKQDFEVKNRAELITKNNEDEDSISKKTDDSTNTEDQSSIEEDFENTEDKEHTENIEKGKDEKDEENEDREQNTEEEEHNGDEDDNEQADLGDFM